MSIWAAKRQLLYISYVVLFFTILLAAGYFLFIFKPPSCDDGKQNGYEEGVDCGGGCQLVCPFSATEPNVLWSRAFEIAPGLYNFSALIENPNFNVGGDIAYVFRAYDEDNILVAEVFGEVPLYPAQKLPLFEASVETGQRKVSRVFLEFVGQPRWLKIQQPVNRIVSQGYLLDDVDTTPKLRAQLYNTGVRAVKNVTVVAVLFDEDENIYQTSQTYVERVEADSTTDAFFTWRAPFERSIRNVEIYIIEPRTDD